MDSCRLLEILRMKKITFWLLGVSVGLFVIILFAQMVASERVEVVELHALDDLGERVTTRLWIVDDEGFQYLRVGGAGSAWYRRIKANETVELTRYGETLSYTKQDRPKKSERINTLMQTKYTWGDDLIAALVGSREGSIPIELRPLK